jgi:hypothetical protein
MKYKGTSLLLIVLVISLPPGAWVAYHLLKCPRFCPSGTGLSFPTAAESLADDFRKQEPLSAASYERLFRYFLEGFEAYRTPSGALADYPGLPSKHDRRADQLEGFSRMAPLMAAWLSAGREQVLTVSDGHTVALPALLASAVTEGTNPASPDYWGHMQDRDQRIVEAADIALTLWLTRDLVWNKLDPETRESIAQWLQEVNGKQVRDGNWQLFVVLVNAVLLDLDCDQGNRDEMLAQYKRFKHLYRGEGWFADGDETHGEAFDFYNAWSMHYWLYWLNRIDPDLDGAFIDQALDEFLASYKYLFGAEGFPIFGRSICYRMALPAPLVFGHVEHPDQVSAGEARRAMDTIWQYFAQHGSLKAGTVTQGYCGADPRILDHYMGPASCNWSLRSLVAALALPEDSEFWNTPGQPLPVELGDYRKALGPTGRVAVGEQSRARISLVRSDIVDDIMDKPLPEPAALHPYTLKDRWHEMKHCRVLRPHNKKAGYHQKVYRSDVTFCGCR